MNIPVITLISLVLAIGIGIKRKINCGIVAVIFTYVIGYHLVGMKASAIYVQGWPIGLFFLALSIMLLFGIANVNGTTAVLSKNIVFLARGNNKILPILFFFASAIISGVGGGAPLCSVLFPIALAVGEENGVPALLMIIMTSTGLMAGGLSPLALNGIVGSSLAAKEGVAEYWPIWKTYIITQVVFAIVSYIVLQGYKIKSAKDVLAIHPEKFNKNQILTLLVIIAMVVGVIGFGLDPALLAFVGAALLLIMGAGDEKKAIGVIGWSALIMICGMTMLINVIKVGGGIELLSQILMPLMNEKTASTIMALLGGFMTAVSSSTGVVMPTLIPATTDIAKQLGGTVSVSGLIAGIIVGSHCVVISPLSTVGAIAIASAPESVDKAKLFNQLLIAAIIFLIAGAMFGLLGLY